MKTMQPFVLMFVYVYTFKSQTDENTRRLNQLKYFPEKVILDSKTG